MKGRLLGGRYLLEKNVGEGGMGIVWRSKDQQTGETVAVKVIRDKIATETRAVKRFLREAQAAGQLSHPGIVRILDEGTDVEHYLVMEYVEGVTIREWVRTYGRAWRPITKLLGELLAALHHAHSRGIMHRDLKPENIIINGEHHAKLMDFGLARPMFGHGATITQSGAIVGTVAYMSPEQAAGKRGDERSDLYSLGVVAYELLTGKRPFSGDSPMETLLKHIQDDPVPLRRHNPGLPESLEDVILKLLAKKPDERYANAQKTWEALCAVLEAPATPPVQLKPRLHTRPAPKPPANNETAAVPTRALRPPPLRPTAVAALKSLPERKSRPQPQPGDELPPIELSVLYTEVQSLTELLNERHPLEHAELASFYNHCVEAVARKTKGRILDREGSIQILIFDGTEVQNPAAHAVMAVERLKEEVREMAERSSGDGPPPDFFLSAGIYTSRLRPAKDGSLETSIREEMMSAARRLHDMSAQDRRYCVLCEHTHKRVEHAVDATHVKRAWVSGRARPLEAYEMKRLEA